MAKNIVIAVLLLCVLALSAAVVRLENFHYASVIGMCNEVRADPLVGSVRYHNCLHAKETRTSAFWHLFYALTGE